MRILKCSALLLLGLPACGGTPTGDAGPTCAPDLSSVQATVIVGDRVEFRWQPACPMALVAVEDTLGADQWATGAPDFSVTDPDRVNIVRPPVVYGRVPDGAASQEPAASLFPGQQYQFSLWRLLPAGSTALCQARFDNLCLEATVRFTR